jgi:hypothetical protein
MALIIQPEVPPLRQERSESVPLVCWWNLSFVRSKMGRLRKPLRNATPPRH